jgi:eukaryotic-like serine/threonine-protein kinase
VLRNRFSENRAQANLFLREGRVGCALRHPNIVPIYEAVSEGKCFFLVMEFVEGRSLREFVRIRKKLNPLEATQMMVGITDGLRYAFEVGHVTHRDLKMSNVLVSSRGVAKLLDFGLASMDESLSDEALADMNTRTVDYAALERATGVRKDDVRSDIYFLGCMYYNMLTGRPPLGETRDRVQRLSKQRFLDVIPIHKADKTLPTCVVLAVNKAMSMDAEKRYQSPAMMVADLRLVVKRLKEGRDEAGGEADESISAAANMPFTERSVMVVESDSHVQEALRKTFKQAGYRVLMTADPARAVGRFRQDPAVADCAFFNVQQVGMPAVEMFNELGKDDRTREVPAVLLLGERQKTWQSQAQTAAHRAVLTMPVTLGQLRTTLEKLIAAKPS